MTTISNDKTFHKKYYQKNKDNIYDLKNNIAFNKTNHKILVIEEKYKNDNKEDIKLETIEENKKYHNKGKIINKENNLRMGIKNEKDNINSYIEKDRKYKKEKYKTIDENKDLSNSKLKFIITENSKNKLKEYKNSNWKIKGLLWKADLNNSKSNLKDKEGRNEKNNKNKIKNITTYNSDEYNINNLRKNDLKIINDENERKLVEKDLKDVTLWGALKIDDKRIKQNKPLYDAIKHRLTNLLSKSKLPLFNIDNFLIWEKKGCGSNGEIFLITSNKTNKNYAVKIIKEEAIPFLEQDIKEFELISQNKHRNIVNVYGICVRCIHTNLFMLYVLMDVALNDWEEEISNRIKEKNYYTENELIIILKQLISALLYLQKEKSISHRDIKLENILIFKDNVFKLCDFGEAKQKLERNVRNTLKGTDFYMSPLLYKGLINQANYVQHNPYKSDVFSLGICFIIAASLNFNIMKEIRKCNKDEQIKQFVLKNFGERYSDDFIYCIMKMVALEEMKRPDFVELSRIVQNYYYDIK